MIAEDIEVIIFTLKVKHTKREANDFSLKESASKKKNSFTLKY
jgi:hypothetical protein